MTGCVRHLLGRRTSWLIFPGLLALSNCELPDDMVVRSVGLAGSGGSGDATGNGGSGDTAGSGGGSSGSATSCDPDLTAVPVLPSETGALRRCSGWAARRTFSHALCSCGSVEVPDVLATEAIDSEEGGTEAPPGGASVGINGEYGGGDYLRVDGSLTISGNSTLAVAGGIDVGSDLRLRGPATAAGPIFVGRDAWLLGEVSTLSVASVLRDLYLGPDGSFSALGATSVLGSTFETTFDVPSACACAPEQILDIAGIVADVVSVNDNQRIDLALDQLDGAASPSTLHLSCGRYALRGISGSAPITLRVSGRVVLAVEGDVELPPNFSVELEPFAQLDWFISGNLEMNPDARLGSVYRPAAVRVYVLGANEIALPGSPNVAINLYAPRADVNVDIAGNVFGALFAANVRANGLLFVHYDRAVLRAEDACTDEPAATCTSCDVCGPAAACAAGSCGPCVTDADCCFPLVCESGRCGPLLFD